MLTHAETVARLRAIRTDMSVIAGLSAPTDADHTRFTELAAEFDRVDADRLRLERTATIGRIGAGLLHTERGSGGEGASGFQPSVAGSTLAVRSGESLAAWGARTGRLPTGMPGEGLSFDKLVRGIATGEWADADGELRAVSENPASAGGHLMPVPVAMSVIDRARAVAQVLAAGATMVPMTSATMKYPRLLSADGPLWRQENAPIADRAMTFDAVTLTAQSLACRVNISFELFEDAPPTSDVIEQEFAQAFALELDRVALRGSGVAPEPRGVRTTSGVSTVAFGGGNGGTPTSYDHLLDAVQTVRASNFTPSAIIASPRSENTLAKLREGVGTGPYLAAPASLDTIPRLTTNQIAGNLTTGTSTDTSEVYVGDWRQMLIGIRTSLQIRLLTERYADVGQYSFLMTFRGDVQLAQPGAFVVLAGIRP